MDGTSSAGNVVRFPAGRIPAGRRTQLTVDDVEDLLRERWQDVVNEPIPGRWLQLLSLFERIEAERSLDRTDTGPAPVAAPQSRPTTAAQATAARARERG